MFPSLQVEKNGPGVKKGDPIIKQTCKHQQNQRMFTKRGPQTVLGLCNAWSDGTRRKKQVQFATLLHVLGHGKPMKEYEKLEKLYNRLDFPDVPRMHWSGSLGRFMAEAMYDVVSLET